MKNIIIVGGTVDSRKIIESFLLEDFSVIATITTEFGKSLIKEHKNLKIIEEKLSTEDIVNLININKVEVLIDASHPYAVNISKNAMNSCVNTNIKYIRFERGETYIDSLKITRVKTYEEASLKANHIQGNILLTTGSNHIETFVKNIKSFEERLFARVLPISEIIKKCESFGLTPNNIIAIKGPFTEEMNIQILKYCNAKTLVTKDSGMEGGTSEKLIAATKLGINIILIERPQLDYITKASNIEELFKLVKEQ